MSIVNYFLDGVDFKTFGVHVSDSDGITNSPKFKKAPKFSWDDYHGDCVDLSQRYYEPRQITLSCFCKADTKGAFVKQMSDFEAKFRKNGTVRLTVDTNVGKPLIFETYCEDAIEVKKEWSDDLMVGTFKLKLIEPEPVKKVLKFTGSGTCTITLTTDKLVNIYWGDGSVDYDISGTSRTITHTYSGQGEHFPVITGCIEEISGFQSNAVVIWEQI